MEIEGYFHDNLSFRTKKDNDKVEYCFRNKIYDIDQVNDILHACDLSLLTK